MVTTTTRVTAEELVAMPDTELTELVDGEVVRTMPAQQRQGYYAAELHLAIGNFAKERKIGITGIAEVGYLVSRDPDVVRAPDVSYVSRERVPPEGPADGYWPFAPDLAVEVASPSESYANVLLKVEQYLAAGSRLVWVLEPETRTIAVHARDGVRLLREGDTLDGGDVLPGFSLLVAVFFRPPWATA